MEDFEHIVRFVFNTSSPNTGSEIGTCKLFEECLEKAMLLNYRLSMYVVEAVTGNTKKFH